MKTVADLDLKGLKVLVRVDFNVPLDEELRVADDMRIRAALPTIRLLLDKGNEVILMSHLGRPKSGPEDRFSLKHVLPRLSELVDAEVFFAPDCIGEPAREAVSRLKPGQVLLLENLRFHPEEKKGDEAFARQLAELADFYVNDAFGTAHRAHASTAVIARYFTGRKASGLLLAAEVENARKVLHEADKPFTAIMGGAKVSDKIPIIRNLMKRADHILIGGGMAYTFVAARGGQIGNSLCEPEQFELTLELLKEARESQTGIHLPFDSVIADSFSETANHRISPVNQIPDGWMGLDIGPDTIARYSEIIQRSATVLWNGPMGVFEMKPYAEGTKAIARAVAEATAKGTYSLIGGGDSVSAVNQLGLAARMSYVSTGGGALLEMLEGKTLPGVQALLD